MRVGFVGCVEFSRSALSVLVELHERMVCELVGVVTKRESSFNADFVDLSPLAAALAVPVLNYAGRDQDVADFFSSLHVDVIYCFGWSHLLPKELLSLSPKGVIGFHPAALPRNRGRHPIVWALALGLDETASTFFMMDEGADSGAIVSQELVRIQPTDDAGTLYKKITEVALKQIPVFTRDLSDGTLKLTWQDASKANYWRKRGPTDGLVDWRMEASNIHNLVRALTRPYVGAHFLDDKRREVKLWKSSVDEFLYPKNFEPGKILKVDGRRVLVKCAGRKAVWLEEHELRVIPEVDDYFY